MPMLTCQCHLMSPVFDVAVEASDDVSVTLEQQGVFGSGDVTWVFWAEGDDVAAFEEGLEPDPTVEEYSVIGGDDRRRLYQVRLSRVGRKRSASTCWTEASGQFMGATRSDGWWTLRIRFPDRESVRTFFECCADLDGVTASLLQLYESDTTGERPYGLSRRQLETLQTAFDAGYFEIPRDAALDDLAVELDVSDNAISERLRRGIRSVLEATLFETDEE